MQLLPYQMSTSTSLCPLNVSAGSNLCMTVNANGRPVANGVAAPAIQAGQVQVSNGTATITFPSAFSSTPVLTGTVYQSGLGLQSYILTVVFTQISTTGATAFVQYYAQNSNNMGNAGSVAMLNWIAVAS